MMADMNDHNRFDIDMFALPVKDIVKKATKENPTFSFSNMAGPSKTNPPTDRIG